MCRRSSATIINETARPLSPCQPMAAVIASLGSKFRLKYGFRFVRPHPNTANQGSPIWRLRLPPTNPPEAACREVCKLAFEYSNRLVSTPARVCVPKTGSRYAPTQTLVSSCRQRKFRSCPAPLSLYRYSPIVSLNERSSPASAYDTQGDAVSIDSKNNDRNFMTHALCLSSYIDPGSRRPCRPCAGSARQ